VTEIPGALAPLSSALPVAGDWLDGTHVPLDVAQAMTEEQLLALGGWLSAYARFGEHLRRAVGAALHKRRSEFARGEWTPYVARLAESLGVGTETLGRWMAEAEKHYGLGLPKGANPTRRGPLAGRRPKPELAPNASSASPSPAKPDRPPAPGPRPAPRQPGARPRQPGAPDRPEAAREVCPRCHGEGTIPVPVPGRNAPDTSAQTCAHPKRKQLGYMTLCADCGTNLSGR
jgi:hypothetical protein